MKQDAYLGLDVSKGYADMILLDSQRNQLEPAFQLDDNRQGHDRLQSLLKQFRQQHNLQIIYCGLESTGGFENNWYNSLGKWSDDLSLKVTRLNPAAVKANRDAGLNRNVSDELSAHAIADYLIAHSDKVSYDQKNFSKMDALRRVYKYHNMLKKQASQLNSQLVQLLYESFPEALRYCRSGVPGWMLELLISYPSARRLTKARVNSIEKIPFIKKENATQLHQLAKHSVAAVTDLYQEQLVRSLAMELQHKRESIAQQKAVLESFSGDDRVELLCSIPGIGRYSAVCILIELEDVRRFPSAKQLASYFGVHPVFKQSGDHTGAFRMSKQGRAGMREVLFMCAKTAARTDPHLKQIFEHHKQKGKKYRAALGVMMHKLLRIVFGVLTSKTTYNPVVDQKQQQKQIPGKQEQENQKTKRQRRHQALNLAAPISRYNLVKRKALLKSQSSFRATSEEVGK